MSELLEKILSKDNMNAAYKRVCANKGAGGVDDVTVEELGDTQAKRRSEETRNPDRYGQGYSARHSTGDKPDV